MKRASSGVTNIMKQLQASQTGRLILQHIQGGNGFSVTDVLASIFTVSVRFLEAAVVTVIAGFYLAAQPQLYRSGLAKLFPRGLRKEANDTFEGGDIIQMVIGALSTLAVWLIGLPSPLALGVIAGLAEFVPYVGPIVAAVQATGGDHARRECRIVDGDSLHPHSSTGRKSDCAADPALVFGGFAVIFAGPIAVIIFCCCQ
jgi:predicted PurR-regulated permease PerM